MVASKLFAANRNGIEVTIADSDAVANWASTKYFDRFEFEKKVEFAPIDNFQPVTVVSSGIFVGLVIEIETVTVDRLCQFELQGDPACDRRQSPICDGGY